jgi:hypothetical protein
MSSPRDDVQVTGPGPAAGAESNGSEGTSSGQPYDLLCGVPRGIPPGFWATRAALTEFTAFAAGLARYIAGIKVRIRP